MAHSSACAAAIAAATIVAAADDDECIYGRERVTNDNSVALVDGRDSHKAIAANAHDARHSFRLMASRLTCAQRYWPRCRVARADS